ncbi:cytochrome P450 71A1 [Amborella trichopoda]|uniref:cytochrome P450 71A1 n=1 Tax=Amborella trichopoda TaxID=13333 RepID=UPI0009BEC5E1|nr:cytochrome P450 71A1 [Amborella trichopoda]|eukprot:XP_011627085.2 cytochrome P450 71A1 [Amborella trichopoda]
MAGFWVWLLVFAAILAVIQILLNRKARSLNLPPGPRRFPVIGNLHQLGKRPHQSLARLSQQYGPLMFIKVGRVPTIVVSSAEIAKEVMKTQDMVFANRPGLFAAEKLLYGGTGVIFSPYGEYWRQVRKICALELLSTKKVKSFQSVREEEVASMVSTISCFSHGDPVNLSKMFYTLTNRISCKVALGHSEGDQTEYRLHKIVQELNSLLGSFFAADLFPSMGWVDVLTGIRARVKKNFRELDSFLDEVIRNHRDKGVLEPTTANKDFVDILLQAQKDYSLDIPLTLDNLKAIILDMFAAGTETSATTLEWLMSELVKNPEAMRKAQEELHRVMGVKGKLNVSEDELPELEYLHSVIKEVLRLHPPAPLLVPRESRNSTKINEFDIPAKTRVYINAWAIGRHPDYWDRAEEFLPERFMSSAIDFKGQTFEFIPFGAGRRSCPGYLFAIHTVALTVANLINHFEWAVPPGGLDMAESNGIAHRKHPLFLLATPRCI